MSVATDRLPVWTLVTPVLALGAFVALKGSASVIAGLVLGVALLAAV